MTENEFEECPSCKPKPGSPDLCASCQHNRGLISRYRRKSVESATQAACWRTIATRLFQLIEGSDDR